MFHLKVSESRRMLWAGTEEWMQSHSRAEFPNRLVRNYGRPRYRSYRYDSIWQRGRESVKSGGTAVKWIYRPENFKRSFRDVYFCANYKRCKKNYIDVHASLLANECQWNSFYSAPARHEIGTKCLWVASLVLKETIRASLLAEEWSFR